MMINALSGNNYIRTRFLPVTHGADAMYLRAKNPGFQQTIRCVVILLRFSDAVDRTRNTAAIEHPKSRENVVCFALIYNPITTITLLYSG